MELSKSTAQVHDDVTVTCTVTNDIFAIVKWLRRVNGQEVEIGTNTFLNEEFTTTGRYQVSFNTPTNSAGLIVFELQISGEFDSLIKTL